MSLNVLLYNAATAGAVNCESGHWNHDWILSAGRRSIFLFKLNLCKECILLSSVWIDFPPYKSDSMKSGGSWRKKKESKLLDDSDRRGCNCDKLPSIFRTNHQSMCTWFRIPISSVVLFSFLCHPTLMGAPNRNWASIHEIEKVRDFTSSQKSSSSSRYPIFCSFPSFLPLANRWAKHFGSHTDFNSLSKNKN